MEYDIFILRGGGQVNEDECAGLEKLLGEENVKIRKIMVTAKDHVYVFYDPKAELVEQETKQVAFLRNIAGEMSKNTVYSKLSNAKQRNLYLCEYCHVTKADAEDIGELVKILEVEESVARDDAVARVKAKLEKKEKGGKKDE